MMTDELGCLAKLPAPRPTLGADYERCVNDFTCVRFEFKGLCMLQANVSLQSRPVRLHTPH